MFGRPLFWRETHKQVRFLIFDGRVIVLLLLAAMHFRVWTVTLAIVSILVQWGFSRKGVSADDILRFIRASIVGRRRTARGHGAERSVVDFGFETPAHVARTIARNEAIRAAHKKSASKSKRTAGGKSSRATTGGGA